jgi:hypothetical protein
MKKTFLILSIFVDMVLHSAGMLRSVEIYAIPCPCIPSGMQPKLRYHESDNLIFEKYFSHIPKKVVFLRP